MIQPLSVPPINDEVPDECYENDEAAQPFDQEPARDGAHEHRLERASDPEDVDTSSWEPIDLAPYLDGSHVPETPSILARTDGRCLIYPGRTHSLVGEPGGMKSWLAVIACVEQILAGNHVIYIDFEDIPAGLVARLLALGVTPADIEARFHYVRPSDPIGPARWAAMANTIEWYAPSLAVVDGVTEAMVLHGWELEKNSDVAKFLGALLRPLADAGPAVLQVDHVTKSAEGRGRYALGAQHKLAGLTGAQYALEVFQPFGHGRQGAARYASPRTAWGGRQHLRDK